MIFVTVGTSTFPFDRLMRSIDELGVGDQLVVQYGASGIVPNARITHRFMSYTDVVENMQRARVVIAHGGVGSILTALHAGKQPIVVPRRRRYGEAVDDHQADLATQLGRRGVVTLVDDLAELGSQIMKVPTALAFTATSSTLADAIREFVDSELGLVPR